MIQNKCKIIGITGGIATGKSTAAKIIADKGYKIIDADKIAREIVEIGKPAYIEIVNEFGHKILLEDKTINRKTLGEIIFNDYKSRAKLNKITHPHISEIIKSNIQTICEDDNIVFLDIPLLFEQSHLWKKYNIEFDEILLIYLEEETQIARLKNRDKISTEDAIRKIKAQLSMDEKRNRSSRIIDNSGDIERLKEEIEKLLLELI